MYTFMVSGTVCANVAWEVVAKDHVNITKLYIYTSATRSNGHILTPTLTFDVLFHVLVRTNSKAELKA